MTEDDKVFTNVCRLLSQNKINFWICHGTLLGIIRENRLLPWDHDIDFAVWDTETSKDKIIEIFSNNGFKQEHVFGDLDCLHFYGVDKKVDISFYKVYDNIASIKWAAPPNSFLAKVYVYFVQTIWEESFVNIELSKNIIKKIFHFIFIVLSFIIGTLLSKKIKNKLYNHAFQFLNYTGYSYPLNLMVFKEIWFNEVLIKVPNNSTRCLELTYGENWKTPKKNYIWYEEATNLRDSS
jgi:hypothetical protein